MFHNPFTLCSYFQRPFILTNQCDHLLVVESHPGEDVADVRRPERGVGEAAVGGAGLPAGLVGAAGAPGHDGA